MSIRPWRRLGAMSAVFACSLAANAGAATTTKPYSVVMQPAEIAAGATTDVTATVTNNASPQPIGSIQFLPPANLQATGTGLFLNQSIAPGGSATYTFHVTAPCTTQPAAAWSVRAKQSNDFSGTPGNDFGPLSGSLTTKVTGSCSLSWTTQPHIAKNGSAVSAVDFKPQEPWPAVSLLDGNGNPIAGKTITVKLGPKVGTGTMADRLPVTGADGAAQLRPDRGTGAVLGAAGQYSFTASYGSVTPATSTSFAVQDQVAFCTPNCSTVSSSDVATVNVSNDQTVMTSGYLSSSLFASSSVPAPVCKDYQSISSSWSTVIASTGVSKTVVYRIDKSDMNKAPQNGAGGIHVCYGEPAPTAAEFNKFSSDPANPANWWWQSGVLPGTSPELWDSDGQNGPDGAKWVLNTCRASGGARPCEDRTFKNGQGDGIAQYLLSPAIGDPMSRP